MNRSGWLLAPAALVLVPGALERLGAPFEDEALRTPLSFAAVAAGLAGAATRGAPRSLAFAAALGMGLPVFLHPTEPWEGTPILLLLAFVGVALGARRGGAPAVREPLEAGLGLAGVLAAVWILADAVLGRPAVGPLGRAGVAGPLLAALLPFAALLGLRGLRTLPFPARLLPALVVVAGIGATGSRTAAFAAGFGALVAYALAAEGATRRRRLIAGGVLGSLALVGLVLGVTGSVPGLVGRTDTVVVREGLAKASASLIAERPLTGHGPHGFASEVLRVRDPEEARISDGRRPLAAHDDVLHFAVEGGVLAGLSALALLGLAVRGGVRSGSASAAGAAVAVAVASLAEDPLLASPTALLVGFLAGLPRGGEDLGAPETRRLARPTIGLAIYLAGVGLLGLATAGPSSPGIPDQTLRDETTRVWAHRRAAALERAGKVNEAKEAYGELLRLDPGMTEARLDLAEIEQRAGNPGRAREVLEEARRRDPTRFDVPLRLGHLAMGEEPAPSEPAAPKDPVAVLRFYDEAIALAPRRFEGHVALARVHRRMGRLDDARHELVFVAAPLARPAMAGEVAGLASETLVELFRIAEAKGSLEEALAVLSLACTKSAPAAADMRDEVERFLDVGDAAEAEALKAAQTSFKPDLSAARKDRVAASLRIAALVESGRVSEGDVTAAARADLKAAKKGRAVARWRALLWDSERLKNADLLLEAGVAATGVDPEAADQWKSRGRMLLGYEALAKEDWPAAVRDFRASIDKNPSNAAAKYGLARALAHLGKFDDAARHLGEAITLQPSLRAVAAAQPDLKDVLPLLPR